MNKSLSGKSEALKAYFDAVQRLRDENILTNQKDFTCQVGEWLVEQLYDGKRSTNGIQKGWDVTVGDKHIQVKSHAKAGTNSNEYSVIEKESAERIDELVIVVFTETYKLKKFYKAPWAEAVGHISKRGKKNPRNQIRWGDLDEYLVPLHQLPKQDIVSLFK